MSGRTVLVVEDDQALRWAVCEVLRDEGYDVVDATNGREALDYLESARELPQMILLDLMMPVLDGAGFRERQLGDARLADIPVLVMTASRDLLRFRVPSGALLFKPIAIEDLLAAVERTLKTGTSG